MLNQLFVWSSQKIGKKLRECDKLSTVPNSAESSGKYPNELMPKGILETAELFIAFEQFFSLVTGRIPTFTPHLLELIAENFSRDIDRINGNIRAISHSTDRVGEVNNQVRISITEQLRDLHGPYFCWACNLNLEDVLFMIFKSVFRAASFGTT